MSLRINTNVDAINAANNLAKTTSMISKSMERLSTGKRINSAADDAAGLTISEKMIGQINDRNLSGLLHMNTSGLIVIGTKIDAISAMPAKNSSLRCRLASRRRATGMPKIVPGADCGILPAMSPRP